MSNKNEKSDDETEGKESDHVRAFSHLDLHSEYTKRRYRHVESKVGQYIAKIRAEEQQRRAKKFQRHSSMPTSFVTPMTDGTTNNDPTAMCQSSMDLHFVAMKGDSSENMNGMTTSASSSSHGEAASTTSGYGVSNSSSSNVSRHESSDYSGGNSANFIDKATYAQLVDEKERLQSENEYLRLRADEQSSEIFRLKRNFDYIRFDLADCQDKLKRMKAGGNGVGVQSKYLGNTFGGSTVFNSVVNQPLTLTKSTQTELLETPMEIATSGQKYNGTTYEHSGSGAINTNCMLRQRLNSNSSMRKMKSVEAELTFNDVTTKSKMQNSSILSSTQSTPSSSRINRNDSIKQLTYYDRQYGQYVALNTSGDSNASAEINDHRGSVAMPTACERTRAAASSRPRHHNPTSIRHRFMRLLGRCTLCDKLNQSFTSYGCGEEDESNVIDMTQRIQLRPKDGHGTPSSLH